MFLPVQPADGLGPLGRAASTARRTRSLQRRGRTRAPTPPAIWPTPSAWHTETRGPGTDSSAARRIHMQPSQLGDAIAEGRPSCAARFARALSIGANGEVRPAPAGIPLGRL